MNESTIKSKLIRLCKWLKQLDSKLSPVKGFMGSNPLSMMVGIMLRMNYMGIGEPYVGKVYVVIRITGLMIKTT